MKKLLLILITAVVGLVAHADKTIYYDNSATNWDAVNIHYWGSETGDAAMTKFAGSVYKATIPDGATGMAFQKAENNWNNGECTQNAPSCEDKHLYYASGGSSSSRHSVVDKGVYGSEPDPGPGPTPNVDGYYVYFVNKNNWGSVNIFAWNESDNNLTNASGWPGDVMELVSGNTYIWRLPEGKGVPTNVKFSNGGANATDDLVFKNHATYYPDGSIVEEIVHGANILYCHFKTTACAARMATRALSPDVMFSAMMTSILQSWELMRRK